MVAVVGGTGTLGRLAVAELLRRGHQVRILSRNPRGRPDARGMSSGDRRELAEDFERLRPYLLRVAYSRLGSVDEALDVVQEGWLRLHDVFDYSFEEVAGIVGRTPAATRQLAARGRRSVRARRPRHPVGVDEQRRVLAAFLAACQDPQLDALLELLDPRVVFRSDGDGTLSIVAFSFSGGRISEIHAVRNPAKLRHLPTAWR